FQVVEYFEIDAKYKKGKKAIANIRAILEDWIDDKGKVTKIGLLHSNNFTVDYWHGDWSIRERPKYWYNSNKYDVYPRRYHPCSAFRPEYLKVGIDHRLSGLSFLEAIDIVPREPKTETLLKARQYGLLNYFIGGSGSVHSYWPSIKIAMRNGYRFKDVSMWFDYLNLLTYFHKDLHNAKYICPKNLKKEHDRYMRRKRERQRREELERKRKRIEEAEARYAEAIERFKGLSFRSGDIVVKLLESVKEFEQEGDALRHCVFTNDYFAKEGSLVLSARIDGRPVETIEVDLKKFKVEQSRGMHNHPSEHHDRIVSMVRRNMKKIRERARMAS
ncbi:MAG: PcfJ domain-containing protein, partial [Herbaspirillum sp.]